MKQIVSNDDDWEDHAFISEVLTGPSPGRRVEVMRSKEIVAKGHERSLCSWPSLDPYLEAGC